MKKIELSGKYGAGKHALVDDEDYDRLYPHRKWQVDAKGYVVLGYNLETRADALEAGRKYRRKSVYKMHRLVLGVTDALTYVDHIDRNPLNNQKSNLRLATPKQNAQNRKSHRGSSSKYRGVSWYEHCKRWVAYGTLDGKHQVVGYFTDEYEAAVAVHLWRKQHMPFSEEPPPMR